jgi:hypothetical protein
MNHAAMGLLGEWLWGLGGVPGYRDLEHVRVILGWDNPFAYKMGLSVRFEYGTSTDSRYVADPWLSQ